MKIVDYLLMKSPDSWLISETGQVTTRRITLSMAGLILGIFFSFLITGINEIKTPTTQNLTPETLKNQIASQSTSAKSEIKISFPDAKKLLSFGLITIVIFMLTYPALYSSLKLSGNEPAFLVVFVSFQYGFFWQSVVKEGAALIS